MANSDIRGHTSAGKRGFPSEQEFTFPLGNEILSVTHTLVSPGGDILSTLNSEDEGGNRVGHPQRH